MAEIKSSIEIALEKSRHLVFTEEERQAAKRKATAERALGIFNFLANPDVPLEEAAARYRKAAAENLTGFKALFLDHVFANLDFEAPGPRIVAGLSLIGQTAIAKEIEQLKQIQDIYAREVRLSGGELEKKIAKNLAARGISGSAVHPKVEGSRLLDKDLEEFRQKFRREIQPLKHKIAEALGV